MLWQLVVLAMSCKKEVLAVSCKREKRERERHEEIERDIDENKERIKK